MTARSAAATSLRKRVRSSLGTTSRFSFCVEVAGVAVFTGELATEDSAPGLRGTDAIGVVVLRAVDLSFGRGESSFGVGLGTKRGEIASEFGLGGSLELLREMDEIRYQSPMTNVAPKTSNVTKKYPRRPM